MMVLARLLRISSSRQAVGSICVHGLHVCFVLLVSVLPRICSAANVPASVNVHVELLVCVVGCRCASMMCVRVLLYKRLPPGKTWLRPNGLLCGFLYVLCVCFCVCLCVCV